MPTPFRLPSILLIFFIVVSSIDTGRTEDPPKFVFDTGATEWRGERIDLPPTFAPDMKWVGEEDIRFAPGMFSADAEDFFSYVLVFILEPDADISQANIEAELLSYYSGLSTAVMKGKQQQVDTEPFAVELDRVDTATSPPVDATEVTHYNGSIAWVEPFATQQNQILHVEAQLWKHGERPALFLCVSPQMRDHQLWKKLREIRAAFRIES